jgi:4-amino-4-deoxy-L-arabinose transferase-like glycosyltransferase
MRRWLYYYFRKLRKRRLFSIIIPGILIVLTLAAHIWIVTSLQPLQPKDGDGKAYTQLAVNLLERGTFSLDEAPPFQPTYIRLPGYPIFLAGIYYFFGSGNNLAVAVVQGVLDTATCVLASIIALNWEQDDRRKRKAAWLAFVLTALCPFTAVYGSMILTESLATFLLSTTILSATFALKTENRRAAGLWLVLTGVVSGLAVLVRPDSGLFALGVGVSLVVGILFFFGRAEVSSTLRRLKTAILFGGIFTIVFLLSLIPWTIRNERVFGIFQPLAPAHAEAPGEFVPFGYFRWVRTWIDDQRYIAPLLWNMEDYPIKIEQIPGYAFDNEDEKLKVAALLDQYNHSAPPDTDNSQDDSTDESTSDDQPDDDNSNDDEAADLPEAAPADEPQDLKITPEVDAAFAEIADQRIERDLFRYYITLPADRATGMWFDTHSMYYPFAGELFPLKELDTETGQEIWLPLFALLVWIYTLLSFVGASLLVRSPGRRAKFWVLLAALMVLPRVIFFSSLENPEPRYFVELFLFTAIFGAIALARIGFRRDGQKVSVEFDYSPS